MLFQDEIDIAIIFFEKYYSNQHTFEAPTCCSQVYCVVLFTSDKFLMASHTVGGMVLLLVLW